MTVRQLLASLILSVAVSAAAGADEFRVTLLGTGDPIPRTDRFGPATLVEAGDQRLLIDVGRGATQRLVQMKVALRDIDAVFLTHFHSDHLSGIPDLWMTGWLPPPFGRRSEPFEVWGPVGTASLLKNLGGSLRGEPQYQNPRMNCCRRRASRCWRTSLMKTGWCTSRMASG